ncbi:helix-turn-helix domain-containing protein [Nocardia brasiliensis]|uniref:helix-turn-helix domain-containing protein n=1 Tax=Nocardia brasiliensis TaxID=37326 RepID=UPI002455ECED|nr:helix-turn-helix transcriptional regulator [Nocardia brasiliensis]
MAPLNDDNDAHHELADYLARVRQSRGAPSLRAIASDTHYSHTTIARVFNPGAPLPSWPIVEQVARVLGADAARVRQLWECASAPAPSADESGPAVATGQGEPPAPVLRIGLLLLGLMLCVSMVIIAVVQAIDTKGEHALAITDLSQIVFGSSAVAILLVRVWLFRRRGDRLNTGYFGLLLAAVAAWTGGQVAWFVARNIQGQDMPPGHLHDVGFLAMPVFLAAALWIRARRLGIASVRSDIDNVVTYFCMFCGAYAAVLWLLVALDRDVESTLTLVFALYPATDITLSLAAFGPLICGRRIVGSAFLATALLAAAASDIGYLLLKTSPDTQGFPPAAGLGYVAFTAILSVYALITQPLPTTNRPPRAIRGISARPRHLVTAITGLAATVTTAAAALTLRNSLPAPLSTTLTTLTILTTLALALAYFNRERIDESPR